MGLELLKEAMPEYAKDIKLNLSSVLTEAGAPGLTAVQLNGIALACAYATQQPFIIQQMTEITATVLTPADIQAAKAAAAIMAMNNVYYRFTHTVTDPDYGKLPTKLRMSIIGNPGVSKVDFELYALAVSAINNCSYCVEAHINAVYSGGVTKEGIQSAVRIAAVLQAAAQVLSIEAE